MSRTFSAAEVVQMAAWKAQVVGPAKSLDQQRLNTGLRYLDMLVAEIAGTSNHFWEAPGPQSIPLVADQASYAFSLLDTSLQFFHKAWVRTSNGEDTPLTLLNEREWADVGNKSQSGVPDRIWIDHGASKIYPYPIIGTNSTHTLYILGYGFPSDLTKTNGTVAHGLPDAWQRYLVTRLALDVGDGPLIKAPASDRDRWDREARSLLKDLNGYNNRRNRKPFAARSYMP
jgi:hypothetical protein